MNELYHFGVKGMKWGVRKDRKRSVSSKRSRSDNEDYTESRDLLKKSPNKLSNAELRKINERLNLEQQYSNLTTTQKQKGNRFIDKVGNQMKQTAANEEAVDECGEDYPRSRNSLCGQQDPWERTVIFIRLRSQADRSVMPNECRYRCIGARMERVRQSVLRFPVVRRIFLGTSS